MDFGFPDLQQADTIKGFDTFFGGKQIPISGRKKRLGIGAVGENLEPSLDAPGIKDAPDFDGICR